MRNERPNILWYCTDQQRFDTVRALGNTHIHTPALDALVETGATFTNAYCQSPICTPSRASFMTGRYPASHHVHRNGAKQFPSSETLVSRLLAEAGYKCGLVGKLHLSRSDIEEVRPENDGYSDFLWSHHPHAHHGVMGAYGDWLRSEKGVDPMELYESIAGTVIGPGVPSDLHQTTWCSDMAIRFVDDNRSEPWMLSVHPFDPHPPFDPPPEILSTINPDELPLPLFRDTDLPHQLHFENIDQQTRHAQNPEELRRKARAIQKDKPSSTEKAMLNMDSYDPQYLKACYYAMVQHVDMQFARIVDALKTSGQYDNTLIIFHSDHGELLGDHGLLFKGCRFYESLTHVPLMISWPGHIEPGLRSDALVELVDLAPTVLDACGTAIPSYMQGISMLPILLGESDASYHKSTVVSEYNDAVAGKRWKLEDHSHGVMVYDGKYKTCIYGGHEIVEIYDMENDPGEFHNLWLDSDRDELKKTLLHQAMTSYMKTSSAGMERTGVY